MLTVKPKVRFKTERSKVVGERPKETEAESQERAETLWHTLPIITPKTTARSNKTISKTVFMSCLFILFFSLILSYQNVENCFTEKNSCVFVFQKCLKKREFWVF